MRRVRLLLGLSLLTGAALLAGCGHNPFAEEKKATAPEQMGLAEKIAKQADLPDFGNDLRQIAIFYRTYEIELNHPPRDQKAFEAYIQKQAPQLASAIQKGYYVIVPNMKLSANNIIAYQSKGMYAGMHWVAKGDGSFHELSNAELMNSLKTQK